MRDLASEAVRCMVLLGGMATRQLALLDGSSRSYFVLITIDDEQNI